MFRGAGSAHVPSMARPLLISAVLASGRRAAIAAAACVSLFVLLGACDEGRPVNSATTADKCLDTGKHCEFDTQCCSGRCYHETGCAGGKP